MAKEEYIVVHKITVERTWLIVRYKWVIAGSCSILTFGLVSLIKLLMASLKEAHQKNSKLNRTCALFVDTIENGIYQGINVTSSAGFEDTGPCTIVLILYSIICSHYPILAVIIHWLTGGENLKEAEEKAKRCVRNFKRVVGIISHLIQFVINLIITIGFIITCKAANAYLKEQAEEERFSPYSYAGQHTKEMTCSSFLGNDHYKSLATSCAFGWLNIGVLFGSYYVMQWDMI